MRCRGTAADGRLAGRTGSETPGDCQGADRNDIKCKKHMLMEKHSKKNTVKSQQLDGVTPTPTCSFLLEGPASLPMAAVGSVASTNPDTPHPIMEGKRYVNFLDHCL